MKIGVFDSGIGGKTVAKQLEKDFPTDEVLYVNDSSNVPYGAKSMADIRQLTNAAIQPLLKAHCDVIVLACNTATAAAIEFLRQTYPHMPFIGLEPMIKPASLQTKSKIIAVCATPFTLQSERYRALKTVYTSGITVIEPDCSNWASMIEHRTVDELAIHTAIDEVCSNGADIIVLACTHYHWIKEEITSIANGRATVIDPSDAVSRRVRQIMQETR